MKALLEVKDSIYKEAELDQVSTKSSERGKKDIPLSSAKKLAKYIHGIVQEFITP